MTPALETMTSSPPFSDLTVARDDRGRRGRQIALHCGHLVTDCRGGLVELGLPPPGDEHVAALGYEPLRGRQADPAAAAGDDRDLAVKSHRPLRSRLKRIWRRYFMVGLLRRCEVEVR
jgi:hypothetical protein